MNVKNNLLQPMLSCAALFILTLLLLLTACSQTCKTVSPPATSQPVLTGIDVLLSEKMELIQDKRVGLITNPTGVTKSLQSTVDVLFSQPRVQLVALFGPEHGVRGNRPAGSYVETYADEKTGLPVFSLYGKTKKPTAEMLQNIGVLLFDIQDVGVRPYTYIYTMAYAMQAAKEQNIPFIVLDRPNPMGGNRVEGPVLEEKFASFIGLYPIAYVHGMTVGELARYFNVEFQIGADLHVVTMRGWRRDMTFDDTGLPWTPTSPHVPQSVTPFFQAATGAMGELQTVNIGIGYTAPFQMVGAEWINGDEWSAVLTALNLPGVLFRPLFYTPFYGGMANIDLQGVQLHPTDFAQFKPVHTQIALLYTLYHLAPQNNLFSCDLKMFHLAMGTDRIDQAIILGDDLETIQELTQIGLSDFMAKRAKYLLY
jgi:uncharacterized protein YbbC (DUF1343 family)